MKALLLILVSLPLFACPARKIAAEAPPWHEHAVAVTSDRLLFRTFEIVDAPGIAEILNDPETARMVNLYLDDGWTEERVQRVFGNAQQLRIVGQEIWFVITPRQDPRQVIGICVLEWGKGQEVAREDVSFTLVLAPSQQRNGFGRETIVRMARYAFQVLDARNVMFFTYDSNLAMNGLLTDLKIPSAGQLKEKINIYRLERSQVWHAARVNGRAQD